MSEDQRASLLAYMQAVKEADSEAVMEVFYDLLACPCQSLVDATLHYVAMNGSLLLAAND